MVETHKNANIVSRRRPLNYDGNNEKGKKANSAQMLKKQHEQKIIHCLNSDIRFYCSAPLCQNTLMFLLFSLAVFLGAFNMHCRRLFFIKLAFLLLFCAWNLIRLTRFAFSLFQGSVSSVPRLSMPLFRKGGKYLLLL